MSNTNNSLFVNIYDVQGNIIENYLKNVNVRIEGYKHKTQKPIYDVSAERKTIFNLDSPTPYYLAFLQFMNNEFAKIYTDFKNNDGDIITSHLFDNTYNADKDNEKILEQYKQKYVSNFTKIEPEVIKIDDYKNTKDDYYPHFESDMMATTRELQYQEIESIMGIDTDKKGIQEHTSLEFLYIIVKRIEGLYNCLYTNVDKTIENKMYYRQELDREIEELEKLLGITKKKHRNDNNNNTNWGSINTNITKIKQKIETLKGNKNNEKAIEIVKDHCKNILWGINDTKYNEKLTHDKFKKEKLKEFKAFIEDKKKNPNELLFLKTFMIDCFKKDSDNKYTNEIDWDKVFEIVGNRKHYQICFGFDDDIKKYEDYKSFFKTLNSIEMDIKTYYKQNCNYLIVWTIFMNFYFNKCAISNTDIAIPIKFKLPTTTQNCIFPISKDKDNKYHYSEVKYNFRSLPRNQTIFDNNNIKFIGFINIKFYYEKVKEFRNWTLFVFKNSNKKTFFLNYKTGELDEYPILSHELEYIYSGSIVSRDSATYEEIKFFKTESDKKNIFIYVSNKDNHTLFITPNNLFHSNSILDSKYSYLQELNLERVKIESIGEHITTDRKNRAIKITPYNNIHAGGSTNSKLSLNLALKLSLKLNNTLSIYNNYMNDGDIYSNYLETTYTINIIEVLEGETIIYNFNKTLYKYLLLSPNELGYFYLDNSIKNNKILTKYIPISSKFYHYNELFINYNLFNENNKNTKILCIGGITPIELIKYKNYKCNSIKFINFYKLLNNQNQLINTIKSIYDININDNFTYENLYLLPTLYPELYNSFNLNIYSINLIDKEFYMLDTFYNVINIFIGALVGLKYTALNGTFIINLNDVSNKAHADIYLILKPYFKESHLYYPEISNMVKLSGVFGIFKGFKGIPSDELYNLENIFEQLKQDYPNNMLKTFNIYDTEFRKQFNITKQIEPSGKRFQYIDGFLNIPKNSREFESTYREIIDFNNLNYINRLSYVKKLLYLYENNKNNKNNKNNNFNVNVPTQDQILSSILYCRKYDIHIFDKYSITKQDTTITKIILNDLYGLHKPILHKFKTPFQTNKYLANKLVFHPKFKSLSRTKPKKLTTHKSLPFKTKTKIKTKKHNLSMSFFNDLFDNDTSTKSTYSKHKTSKYKSSSKTKKQSKLRHSNMSLEESVFNSNNQLVQAGRLIDVRKDFTKENPTELYDKLKDQLRYYKGWGKAKPGQKNMNHTRTVPDLTNKVQFLLHDYNISQAWLKMYEIITDCDLIPTNRKGIYKSFHICEAPGTFISCINNYIHTKTNYDAFEWKSQSLKPKGSKSKATTIYDTYGFIKRYPNKWDFSVDDTGDITNIENIKYYAKIAKDMNINLMTSDCGLPWGDSKYYQVAYASYVSLLYSLPQNGTMLYKILSPIDVPLIWNLIYITYTNFKEMYFFKPVQNSQSREFYIIGKGYLGTEQSVLNKLLNLIPKFEDRGVGSKFNKEEYDLFNDTYPEEFVIQVQNICEKLASNYVNSIERIIYYVDNIDGLGKDYQKHIESYMKEKNEDWIRKYKVIKIDKKFVL